MDIIFINKQAFYATIDKDIQFRVLAPLSNIKKEEFYRTLDALIKNYNTAGFPIKRIEFYGEFKLIMDEVYNDMGI